MSGPTTNFDGAPFLPGHLFAGRYRIVTRIGRGGMAEVWQAEDLVLQTSVALKLIHANTKEGRQRIINETRLARQITHPAVCRVFDVGEAEGQIFYSMELVHGEDLATLLRRVGRLPMEKVIAIGRDLCAGVAAAHAQGVLHRDLKPANVLMDENGAVRITDFGIAVVADGTGDHGFAGTPGYMAPEQLSPGAPLSDRTDLYALGVILYELLVGRRPYDNRFQGPSQPPRPSAVIAGVDQRLERVILQALEPDPQLRPPSAAEMAAKLSAIPAARATPLRPWLAGAAVVAVVGALALGASLLFSRGARALTNQDVIVLADFVNTTGEPVFDGTLKVALAVALEQSPFLKVFPDERVRETLRLMQRPLDERITRATAREIARREQLKALVAGSISTLGSQYVLALEAVNAETGDVMAREQVEVPAKEQLLTSLGQASAKLREELGESLVSVQRFDVPLPEATTPSLEALHAYALALDQGRVLPRAEAIPPLKRAIELDPNFAMAYALLSGVYANTGRSAEAPVFSRRAFELRDRVSERERFFISWRFYLDAAQAWDQALDLALSWTMTYPRDAFAFNSLGLASGTLGQHDQAVQAFREAIRLDARFVPPYGNQAGSLIALNRFDESKMVLEDASKHGIDFISLRRMAYTLAFLNNDQAGMAHELDLIRTTPEGMWSAVWEARTSVFSGRFANAHDLYGQGVRAALAGDFRELAGQWTIEDAEAHAVAGECAEARRQVSQGLALGRDNFALERAGRTLALCRSRDDELSGVTAELARRFSQATLTIRLQLPVIDAARAVARRDPQRALKVLDSVKPYDHAPAAEFWPSYLRGQAFLEEKDGANAAVEFQNIIDRRGQAPASPLYALAHLGLARAAALTGDPGSARQGYLRFFALWETADSTLPPLQEARQEYARLQ